MNVEGSQEVQESLLDFIEKNHEKLLPNEIVKDIRNFCARKPMAVLEKVASFLEKNPSKEELKKFRMSIKASFNRTVEYAASFFKSKKILTLSNSKTLFQVFLKAKPLFVFVLESRPGGEGKVLVQSLQKEGIRAEVIDDLLAYKILKKVDLCAVGADYVDESGNVLNKIGSSVLAVLCRELKKPFLVIADPYKFGSRALEDTDVFEVVPSYLITAIITDPEGGTTC
ncbi:initiation factor 2B [Thermotoga sp. KOL6]|nr:initiation factor 2B [Thermotoga sp. KOL6]